MFVLWKRYRQAAAVAPLMLAMVATASAQAPYPNRNITLVLPFAIWEYSTGVTLKFDFISMATLGYAVIFPSTLAYLFFNRGLALIGPNRAAPFFHLVPVFGSAMAILLLGEQLRLFHLIGYALVLAGVMTASRRASSKA